MLCCLAPLYRPPTTLLFLWERSQASASTTAVAGERYPRAELENTWYLVKLSLAVIGKSLDLGTHIGLDGTCDVASASHGNITAPIVNKV